MGIKHCIPYKNNQIIKKPKQKELQYNKLTSENDKIFLIIENHETNFLSQFELDTLLLILNTTQSKQTNSELNEKYNSHNSLKSIRTRSLNIEIIEEPFFLKLLSKKIVSNVIINQDSSNFDQNKRIFLTYFTHYFSFMYKSFKNFYKDFFGEKYYNTANDMDFIPKIVITALFFQYSNSSMLDKIDLFTSIVLNTNRNSSYINSNDFVLRLFLYSLVNSCSCIALFSLNELGKEDVDIRSKFSEDDFVRLYNAYQVKDCLRITNDVVCMLFDISSDEEIGVSKEISVDTFKWNFISNSLYWIFYPSGVRSYLESNNLSD